MAEPTYRIDHPSSIIGDRSEAANRSKAARLNPNKPINFFGTTIDVTITDNLPGTEEVRASIRRAMQQAVAILAAKYAGSLPRRRGRLAAAIRTSVAQARAGTTTIGVMSVDRREAYKARFLEFGTGPHVIQPRGATKAQRARAYRKAARYGQPKPEFAQALAFQGLGGRTFARRVRHPGVRARRLLQAAGMAATPSIVAAFQEAVRDVVGR